MAAAAKAPEPTGPQKAAMLLLLLGESDSAPLLRHLEEDEVRKIATEITRIGFLKADQAQGALDEFWRMTRDREGMILGGVEPARRILGVALGPEAARAFEGGTDGVSGSPAVAKVRSADPRHLVRILRNEHPQTVALVTSQLDASAAAALLALLPAEERADVTLRMAAMDQISPEVVNRVAQVVADKLSSIGEPERESYAGVKAVSAIFNQMDSAASDPIFEHMQSQNPEIADAIRGMMFGFEDLLSIDASQLKEIMARVDRKAMTTALKGASQSLREHFFSTMSARAVEMLKEEIEAMGPVKMKDVQAAQTQMIATVRELEAEGVVSLRGGESEQYVV